MIELMNLDERRSETIYPEKTLIKIAHEIVKELGIETAFEEVLSAMDIRELNDVFVRIMSNHGWAYEE